MELSGQPHAPIDLSRYTFSNRVWRKESFAPDLNGTSVSFSLALWSNLYTDCTITAEVTNTRVCSSTSPYVCGIVRNSAQR